MMRLILAAGTLVLVYLQPLASAQNDVTIIGTTLPPVTSTSQDVSAATAGTATSTPSPATVTITVNRVENKFVPENVTAQVGDVVKFEFWPTNNSVARSEFAYPCIPYSLTGASKVGLGFYSGFKPIVANLAQINVTELPAYYIIINRVTPIFFYNTAPGACINHQMVGAINPRDATQLSLQKEAAAAATLALSPGEPIPQGSSVSSFDTSTATSTSTSSPPSSRSPATLSPGAVAGIAIGVLAFLALLGVAIWSVRYVRRPPGPRAHRPHSEPDLTSLGTTPRSPVTPATAVSELPGNTIDGVLVGGGRPRPESEGVYVVSRPWTPQQEHMGRGGGTAGSGSVSVSVFEPWQQGRVRLGVVSELSAYGEVRKDQVPSTPPDKHLPELPDEGKKKSGPYELDG